MQNNSATLPSITILGCGLSGMITALAFAKRNIAVTIIEEHSSDDDRFFDDIRTTALTISSKKFFQEIDIWDEIEKISGVFNDIYIADNKSSEMIHLSSDNMCDKEFMGYLVENNLFKRALFKLVLDNKFITILENTDYKIIENQIDKCHLLLNDNIEHKCDLLIACDGRQSKAKQTYFSSNIEKKYNQSAITFIIHHQIQHEGTALEHFMPHGPFAILPLKNQNLSSIVWTVPSDKSDILMKIPKNEFLYLVQENIGKFLGKVEIKSKIASFPLKIYETKKYYNNKIVLVADTAHIMHPLAGQGLNQGIKDIETLTRLVSDYGINEYTLEQYEKTRKADNRDVLEITDFINTIFSNNSKILHLFRQIGFKIIGESSYLTNWIKNYAMGKH